MRKRTCIYRIRHSRVGCSEHCDWRAGTAYDTHVQPNILFLFDSRVSSPLCSQVHGVQYHFHHTDFFNFWLLGTQQGFLPHEQGRSDNTSGVPVVPRNALHCDCLASLNELSSRTSLVVETLQLRLHSMSWFGATHASQQRSEGGKSAILRPRVSCYIGCTSTMGFHLMTVMSGKISEPPERWQPPAIL